MLPVEAFVTTIKFFDRHRLTVPFWGSWLLDCQGSKVKLHAAMCSWSVDFSSLNVTLIHWSVSQKGFGCLIQFWFQSQMLLHGTYKLLALALFWGIFFFVIWFVFSITCNISTFAVPILLSDTIKLKSTDLRSQYNIYILWNRDRWVGLDMGCCAHGGCLGWLQKGLDQHWVARLSYLHR